jgi:hypothetical protein
MYVYCSQSGHFEIAAYTSTRCPATRQRAAFAPSFNTRAEAEAWRAEAEERLKTS